VRVWLAAAALAAVAIGNTDHAQAETIEQKVEQHRNDLGEIDRRGDEFVHRSSGYVFPGKLGEMPARKTYTYGTDNVSLYYTLYGGGNGDAWLSLYVYRSNISLEEDAVGVEQALVDRMPGAVVAPPGLPPPPAGAVEKWFDASVEGEPLLTGFRLVRDGNWHIKVRLSVPKSGGQAALDRAWGGLGLVNWSIKPGTTSPELTLSRSAQY